MNDKVKESLKPTIVKIILSLIFLAWQFFYSYQGIRSHYLNFLGEYFKIGLSGVNWNNYFIRSGFIVLLWLIVASFIYLLIWGWQSFKIYSHNQKIKNNYLNRPESDYQDLLKNPNFKFGKNFSHLLYYVGGAVLLISGFLITSDLFEKIRYGIADNISLNLLENNAISDSGITVIFVLSFVLIYLFWYLYTTLITFVFSIGREKSSLEKITDDHFAVVVEDPEEDEEEE